MKLHNPLHPGRVCWLSYLEEGALPLEEVAARLGLPESRLRAFLEGDSPVDAELALRLAEGFGTSPQFWLKLQQSHDLWQAEQGFDRSSVRPVLD